MEFDGRSMSGPFDDAGGMSHSDHRRIFSVGSSVIAYDDVVQGELLFVGDCCGVNLSLNS